MLFVSSVKLFYLFIFKLKSFLDGAARCLAKCDPSCVLRRKRINSESIVWGENSRFIALIAWVSFISFSPDMNTQSKAKLFSLEIFYNWIQHRIKVGENISVWSRKKRNFSNDFPSRFCSIGVKYKSCSLHNSDVNAKTKFPQETFLIKKSIVNYDKFLRCIISRLRRKTFHNRKLLPTSNQAHEVVAKHL